MGKSWYLAMKTDDVSTDELKSDFKEIGLAVKRLGTHTVSLLGAGLLTSLLQWLATIAAMLNPAFLLGMTIRGFGATPNNSNYGWVSEPWVMGSSLSSVSAGGSVGAEGEIVDLVVSTSLELRDMA